MPVSLCPKPDVCGSCGWSHIPYDKQLQQKLSDINGSFKIKKLDLHVDEIVPSPKTEHYRNRMDFVINFKREVGLREKGKWWKVIDDHPCFLADEQIEALFPAVRSWVQSTSLEPFDRKALTGLLRYAVVRSSTLGQTMITIVTSKPTDEQEDKLIRTELEQFAEVAKPTTLVWAINSTISDVSYGDILHIISGPGFIEEQINGFKYRISPQAFFQTNSYCAGALLDTVREFAGDVSEKSVLDLYCGTGFLTIPLAQTAKAITGVELVAEAIKDAKVNGELNGAGAIAFHDAKTEEFDWMKLGAEVVILDPPRAGMHDKALQDIIKAKPERLVYVSCNYKNFAREMVMLQEYYNVDQLRAIDMFPHTPHVELVALLTKRENC